MEDFGFTHFDAVRRRRSQTIRRPKPESQPYTDSHDRSPLSNTTLLDDVSKASSDENVDTNSRRKEFNLNQCMSRENDLRNKQGGGGYNSSYGDDPRRSGSNIKRFSEGVLAPANWKSSSKLKTLNSESTSMNIYNGRNVESHSLENSGVVVDALGNDSKVKVKLKVGRVTCTIPANSTRNGVSSMKNSRLLDNSRSRQRANIELNFEEDHFLSDKRSGLRGVPWKDFSRGGFLIGKEDPLKGKTSGSNSSEQQGDMSKPVRKSKRIPKRRVLDGDFDNDEEDEEIRYLEKLKLTTAGYREDDEETSKKQRKLSNVESVGALRPVKDGKKSKSEDMDYEEEQEESVSDAELEGSVKKQKKESESIDGKRELALTTRQRALQSSKDGSSRPGANLIEFPNGLPPPSSRKLKEKLTDVEQQLKKAEAAQRRRLQVEKAARENEAEAIRKILGQDSNRKKREEKNKKRQEELAQEKAANALKHQSSTVRWVSGPTGTIVTFPNEMGLPSVVDSKPISYPPPREKCAGPSCNNPYKYRHSKTNIPLCSLQCYKAIEEQMQVETSK